MNIVIVYFSKFSNTQKIAETIAATLKSRASVQLIHMEQLSASDLSEADLVIMGSPTHRMNLPQAVQPVFESLPGRILRDKPVATFDTSYKMSAWLANFTAAKKLARKLRKLGGRQIVPPKTFHVVGREGPLYEGEIERAQVWAKTIMLELSPQLAHTGPQ